MNRLDEIYHAVIDYLRWSLLLRSRPQLPTDRSHEGLPSDPPTKRMGCDVHMWLEWREGDDQPWQIQRRSPCTRDHDTRPSNVCWRCKNTGWDEIHEETEDYGTSEAPDPRTHVTGGGCFHDRNYPLFNVLAGVRGYGQGFEPVFPARGIAPDPSSEYARMVDHQGGDGHSHSWLDRSEVEAAIILTLDPSQHAETRELWGSLESFWEDVVVKQMDPIAARVGPQNVRLVFFFDN